MRSVPSVMPISVAPTTETAETRSRRREASPRSRSTTGFAQSGSNYLASGSASRFSSTRIAAERLQTSVR